MKILIIACSRFKGGMSGGDAIYESFIKYWPNCSFRVWDFQHIDYKPFWLCYLHRIGLSILMSIFEPQHFSFVYSASDFLPDSIAGFIFKLKGQKWVAGFYLKAFKQNRVHFYTQKLVRKLINKFADIVIVTNPTMYDIFPKKKITWINGGIDLSKTGLSNKKRIYDAVFCGRIHPSKGIDELIQIWKLVRNKKKDAKLAIIGDGDLGIGYIKKRLGYKGVTYFGYMGEERFDVYKQSKVVLYPTPSRYDHFSMAPIEAMACGCPMIAWDTHVVHTVVRYLNLEGVLLLPFDDIKLFSDCILKMITDNEYENISRYALSSAKVLCYGKQSMRVYNVVYS